MSNLLTASILSDLVIDTPLTWRGERLVHGYGPVALIDCPACDGLAVEFERVEGQSATITRFYCEACSLQINRVATAEDETVSVRRWPTMF